ncbi:TetR/AcrR family transcriptional regulator [Allorhizocola rhizosphaerae]|uniref:TetR/AcrR family transcriptional regulator n=1 Tax=Allorhizocola rhizosphaerae TaxID=1872709 RepID=UPI001B8B3520|nr:TetR/AcrR family transcriptional regulator [Allorhizocola rhizosphaerae]
MLDVAATGTRKEQKEATRQALITVGRRLFATRGYAAVGLTEIVTAAGVTKGALYHHFGSKADLFRAVLEQVQQEVGQRVAQAADAQPEPWAQLIAGCHAFLAASRDPELQQIMLIDGPAVLGWTEWRAMDETNSARHLADALNTLVDAGTLPRQPVAPLTHLLSGAMNEAALWLATSTRPRDLTDTQAALTRMLESLRR